MLEFIVPIAAMIGIIYCIISLDLYLMEVKMKMWAVNLIRLLIMIAILRLAACFFVPKYVAF